MVKSPLDYETQPKIITMTIQASDGYCDSEVYTLTVRLVDINEPPTLLPVDQTLESCEGLVGIAAEVVVVVITAVVVVVLVVVAVTMVPSDW